VRSGPSITRLQRYARRQLRLGDYLDDPGDGRTFPQIPASALLWGLIASRILRISAFLGIERWVGLARRGFGLKHGFGDDALGYFTERLDAERLRGALCTVVRRAKRNKAFDHASRIGLGLDGTGLGRSRRRHCELCHPHRNSEKEITGYLHKTVGASLLAGDLTLPLDIEYYLPQENELAAAKRLLPRVLSSCAIRFDYIVADGLYAGAPFLHLCEELELPVVVRLKENLPELSAQARARFEGQPPMAVYRIEGERIEIWDAGDFEPWEGLRWANVRVIRYRQHRKNGEICEAYWLTNFSPRQLPSLSLYRICKSRWQIENRFFNEGKNLYGLEHIPHHHPNAILVNTLLACLALCIERLYRTRYLHRGGRRPYTPVELLARLQLALGAPVPNDTS
jgi:hypothetical protein